MARILDESHLEIHRFYHGAFLDSVVIRKSFQSLRSFLENLRCLRDKAGESCVIMPHVHLLCTEAEYAEQKDYGMEWIEEGFPIQLHRLTGCLVTEWVKHLLHQDTIQTFDTEILLKPWRVPRVAWPIMVVVLLFAAYALYQVHSADRLAETSKQLKRQIAQLETEWQPIEELQTRISKFQQDRKNLSSFNSEGYPLLELMTLLTQVTPEDTWLNYLSLRKGQLFLRGESKSAIKYLSDLSKTEGLNNVKFVSPVTRNPGSDHERFNVQIQLDMNRLCKNLEVLPGEKLETCNLPPFKASAPGEGVGSDTSESSGVRSEGEVVFEPPRVLPDDD